MSRETDTPSSGPDGRGGAAYPSGTPPYGTPMVSDDAAGAGRSGSRPEEKKTETTLTTRIRINIPGSRPIPPVVMRKPVGDGEGSGNEAPAAEPRPAADRTPTASAPAGAPAEPAAPAEEKTSDWFAPRKSSASKGGPGGDGTNGAGIPGGSAAPAASTGTPGGRTGGPAASGAAGTTGARPGSGRPGAVVGSMSVGGSRPGGTNGKGLPGATGGPVAPGHGGGTGSFDVTEALNAGPLGAGARPGPGEPRRDGLPYFADQADRTDRPGDTGPDGFGTGPAGAGGQGSGATAAHGHDGYGGTAGGAHGHGGASGYNGPGGQGGPGGPQGPAGPTSGPVTGDGTLAPRAAGGPGAGPGEPFDGPSGAGYGTPPGRSALAGLDGSGAPAARPAGPGGGFGDDTAILTPQKPAPEPGTPGYRSPAAENVSGHTVTSGIPVVPSAGKAPFGTHPDGPAAPAAPKPQQPAAPKAAGKPKKKGRSKLMLLAVGVVVVAGGAYGAGLLMNHTDVPKGTTVLGVDIGGGTRDDAVKKLDDAFGSRVNKPLKLSVGGNTVTLTPENAGLQFDYQATVSDAAKSDYNPVHVVGSLFGQKRVVQPVMPVDEEKLQAALQQAGGGSGSVTDGTIKFESGKAVAVYGKAGKAIDAGRSTNAVEQAYRTLVEQGAAPAVAVPTATRQPTVSNAEVDRMMKDFAKPAMSGLVRVQTDAAHSIPFGPVSLPKIISFKAVDGKLVDTYDLKALKDAYGSTFDGVQVQTATGKRGVLPQDVVAALRKALRGRTAAERVGVVDTNPG
ncbi:membrane protein [Streptomyces sp. NRRL S-1022]|uniref:membrane protein n=1 Tax=Streptomyces sp. NRRL S-1022 TaxID=1463880 RepID=UPI0004BF8787|nr:membrane protein [Streptomyces sp. NRRL S-1022]